MILKTAFLLFLCAAALVMADPQINQADNQYWAISSCLDDNTAAECLDQHPEWADDPQLTEAIRDQVPGCITDTECGAE